MSLTAHEIILRPVISEKSMDVAQHQKYTFAVHDDANKLQIKAAVESLFKVKVASVRVANRVGKVKRMGRFVGSRRDWKKAYVRLAPGEKPIEFFEGV